MKLLLDQGLPRSAAALLNLAGIDTLHVGDIGQADAEDLEILRWGREDGRIVVTLDADFHTLLALSGAALPSVIRIRVEGLRAGELVTLLHLVIDACRDDLEQGAMVTVQPGRVRVHRLPVLHEAGEPRPDEGA